MWAALFGVSWAIILVITFLWYRTNKKFKKLQKLLDGLRRRSQIESMDPSTIGVIEMASVSSAPATLSPAEIQEIPPFGLKSISEEEYFIVSEVVVPWGGQGIRMA
ncbi:hypothetical protein C1H76_4807 [Elsinoe australis]|uniref:Uncharacterized protein n=1 Tax=Elsinoe australis TaxID=40998 RepID=A0A4U7AW88_9PEZI|nr:hypothetical protein C1H76_4807 [Elsinoe australis]